MSQTPDPSKTFVRRLLGRFEPQDIAPLVSLAVLVLFFALATPAGTFLKPSTLVQIFKQGSVPGHRVGRADVRLAVRRDRPGRRDDRAVDGLFMRLAVRASLCRWQGGRWRSVGVDGGARDRYAAGDQPAVRASVGDC